ncbi:sigma-54 dependent transcriptional regulator [Roseovarius sp. M141]|uniref:response regulator n=1 Tax=Roseovarius sp. M141 TaxID=2583806 RepID=UPI0020CD7553|nr:sigma-54 dependent transcriptional regulator [Roseovarius sp. M141]MCQ0093196.1 sigma-54-dependent Fis family transcriptional regulator [Roseovarius sp. M141]
MDGTVLVADDDRSIRTVLTQALTRAGCKVHATSSLTTLMRWIGEGLGDAVITDVMMPDGNGLEMLPKIARDRPGLPVIVISARSTVMTAIRAAEAEAWDYLPKPFDLPDLMARTARALDSRRAAQADRPSAQVQQTDLPLVGQSAPMQALFRVLAQVVQSDLPVWIAGEQGAGKSMIARAVHDLSARQAQPFVIVAPGDLAQDGAPAAILAQAGAGTILLDGLHDMDGATQARALYLVDAVAAQQTGARPRVIATAQPGQGGHELRADLYYRLVGAVIDVPPLRARREDVALLATHFLYLAEEAGAPPRRLSPDALDILRAHDWPGNVRELRHTAERMAWAGRAPLVPASEAAAALQSARVPDRAIPASDTLPDAVAQHVQRYFDLHGQDLPPDGLYHRLLTEFEAPLLRIALDSVAGNQARCAALLGINRNTLRKKLTTLDIEVTRRGKLM